MPTVTAARRWGIVAPARTIASSATHARATEAKNWSCQPHSRFAACPQFRRTSGKNASAALGRPRSREAVRIIAAANAAITRTSKYIVTRMSIVVSRLRPRKIRRGTGTRCSLCCDQSQSQVTG